MELFEVPRGFRLHLRGLVMINFKPGLKVKLMIGGQIIDDVNDEMVSFNTEWFETALHEVVEKNNYDNVCFYPIVQSGSILMPYYHQITVLHHDSINFNVFCLCEVAAPNNSTNILSDGTIAFVKDELFYTF